MSDRPINPRVIYKAVGAMTWTEYDWCVQYDSPLSEKEAAVVCARRGGATYKQIARKEGVSLERARQISMRALRLVHTRLHSVKLRTPR